MKLGTEAYGSICDEHGVRETSGKAGDTITGQGTLVEHTVDEDFGDRVGRAILGTKPRRHEWLRLCAPGIGVIDGEHDHKAGKVPGGCMGLQRQRKRGLVRCNL